MGITVKGKDTPLESAVEAEKRMTALFVPMTLALKSLKTAMVDLVETERQTAT